MIGDFDVVYVKMVRKAGGWGMINSERRRGIYWIIE